MRIETIVEFFWGKKTTYTKVYLYPDGRIEFPDYDIEHDIVLAELEEEPTQQFELYDAYDKYGIFGFDLIGKNSYFWASDYYKVIENPKEKRKWARFICETLGEYLSIDETFVDYQIEFISNVVWEFADSFDVLQTSFGDRGDIGAEGWDLHKSISCESVVQINGVKCLVFDTLVNGAYGYYSIPAPIDKQWRFSIHSHIGDNYWQNINAIIKHIKGQQYKYIKHVPEPYEFDLDFSPFEKAKNPKYVVIIWRKGNLSFKGEYRTVDQVNKTINYLMRWFNLYGHEIITFVKTSPKADDFKYFFDDYGRIHLVSQGWGTIRKKLGD